MYTSIGSGPHADSAVTQAAPEQSQYKPQFAASRDLILRRITAAGKTAQDASNHGKGSENGLLSNSEVFHTLPLPGEIPPQPEEAPSQAAGEGTEKVDFTQPTVYFQAPPPPDITMEDAPVILSGPHAEQRREWLSSLPEGIAPAKAELVGFLSGQASDRSLTEYFYGKKKTDLLNILSFCDQLEPQLLVDLLVAVSRKHPDLPIFDSPDWEAAILAAEASKAAAVQLSRIRQRPRHGHTLLNPRMRKRAKAAVKKVVKRTNSTATEKAAADEQEEEEEEEEEDEEDEDVLPETWPQAGSGLYAKLPPETEDRMYLADEGDDDAFSHFMVDVFGRQTAVGACG